MPDLFLLGDFFLLDGIVHLMKIFYFMSRTFAIQKGGLDGGFK